MRESIVRIKNARKTNDWSVIQDEFEEVNKMVEKSKMLVMKNGLPKFYVKMLADVEDHLWATLKDKEVMNSVKPAIGRAINRMKLTIKKHNKNYEEQIADYRANPDKYEDADESESESDDDSSDSDDSSDESDDEPKAKSKPKAKAPKVHHPPCTLSCHLCLALPLWAHICVCIFPFPISICVLLGVFLACRFVRLYFVFAPILYCAFIHRRVIKGGVT
jgi:hypothetical protein